MAQFSHRFIDISITEPTPLDIGEVKIIHQECMSEFATLKIKNALWVQFSSSHNLNAEDAELVNFKFGNGCYKGRFRVRNKFALHENTEVLKDALNVKGESDGS